MNEDYYRFDIINDGQVVYSRPFNRQDGPILWRIDYFFQRLIPQSLYQRPIIYNDNVILPMEILYDSKTQFILSINSGKKIVSIKKEMTETLLCCFRDFKKQYDARSKEMSSWGTLRIQMPIPEDDKKRSDFITMAKKIRPEFFL